MSKVIASRSDHISLNFTCRCLVMSLLNHMSANSLWQCMRPMYVTTQCTILLMKNWIFSTTCTCFDGLYPIKNTTSEKISLKFSATLWMLEKVLQYVVGRLYATFVKVTKWSLSHASSNKYWRSKPLVGWENGRFNPSRVLTKYKKALKICGQSCLNDKGSLFMFSIIKK